MFNKEVETKKLINFIREYYQKNNLGGCVLGISGGKDSAVVAAIMCDAIGRENVLGVTLSCYSNEEDKNDAKLVADTFGFELINLDLTDTYDVFTKEIKKLGNFTGEDLKNSEINLKPRLRMASCYYLAALYSAIKGKTCIVAGTSNKCECYVGYFTKGGDSVHDIGVLTDYTVSEVIAIGEYLKVPDKILYKEPSDGLSGLSDEDKLGVKYSDIEKYLSGMLDDDIIKSKIEKLHNNSLHKYNVPYLKR